MEFDVKKTISYWLEGAKYDLGVAEAMLKARKYPYALFMGHLALEKLLKALVVKNTKTHAPRTHSLTMLAERSSIDFTKETLTKLDEFMEFHFEPRYPREQRAFYAKCNKGYTTKMLNEIKEVYKWLRKQF